jgi:hypothetical protein
MTRPFTGPVAAPHPQNRKSRLLPDQAPAGHPFTHLVFGAGGALYFTAPPFGLVGQDKDPAKELDFNGVSVSQTVR